MRHILPVLRSAHLARRVAVRNVDGTVVTFGEILRRSRALAAALKQRGIKEPTVACFHKASSGYVETMLATWMLGKRFLPLCTTHPQAELQYFVDDSKAGVIVYSSQEACKKHSFGALPNLGVALVDRSSIAASSSLPEPEPEPEELHPDLNSDALILYTSGTTGRPKGVVHSHLGVTCMITGLVDSWQYSSKDHILHFLPLHHLHGVLNKLLCVLYAGGCVEFLASAHPLEIWTRLAALEAQHPKVNLFMAVPTVYARMIEFAAEATKSDDDKKKEMVLRALASVRADMRLMACGSAALPDTVMNTWRKLTGHVLLERYGMTECGMILSNDYTPVANRTPGHVGKPLPHVNVRLVDDKEQEIGSNGSSSEEVAGELRVKGPTVFREYLNRPDAFRDSFDKDGWFKTGDMAVRRRDTGMYAILGRNSTDIIKSKGYKLSALEIERELLACDDVIREVAVVGRPHPIDGEYVAAVVVLQPSCAMSASASSIADDEQKALVDKIKDFLKTRLANYKSPVRYFFITQPLPRNALGKVNKKTLFSELSLEK